MIQHAVSFQINTRRYCMQSSYEGKAIIGNYNNNEKTHTVKSFMKGPKIKCNKNVNLYNKTI